MNLATGIVLYHPDQHAINRIIDYSRFLAQIIVIDNTETGDLTHLFKDLRAVHYRFQASNLGIASALNQAANYAVENGCSWLLMLDQDSELSESIYNLLSHEAACVSSEQVGIVAPLQISRRENQPPEPAACASQESVFIMTSGSVLNLRAYVACGPFDEKLFIDHVDHEYCLRLRRMHWRAIQNTGIILHHRLGESRSATILGKVFTYTSHSPFRTYYFVRNGLYVATKYFVDCPSFFVWLILQITKNLAKVVIFENEKTLRLRMMLAGMLDFCRSKYGPLNASGIFRP